jgi:predicted AAA+ superfamily ATPase
MIKRLIQQNLFNSLKIYPVVGILGSHQVGKTTLAKTIQAITGKDSSITHGTKGRSPF